MEQKGFLLCPFQGNCFSHGKKEKWKKISFQKTFLILHTITVLAAAAPASGSSSSWDGIIVTQADFEALQAFKRDLIDSNGFLKSWNDSGFGACSGGWPGIKCAQGQVIVIQLPWRSLGGRLTEKLGQFQALRKLSLHDNEIGGAIPTSLGFLPNLRGLQLFNNRFTGSIPASLGFCPLLQTVDLANNSFTGVIPATLVNSTRLFRIDLSFNSLSGSISPSFARSPSLVYLALANNSLSGTIPDFGGQTVSQLQNLNLGNNGLSGSLPIGIGNLSALTVLDLSSNFLNGNLPHSFSNLKNLSVLDLSSNHLTGRILDSVADFSKIQQLHLSHNNFSGEIPDSLSDLPNLHSFNVSYNNLSGHVPTNLSSKFDRSAFLGNPGLCGYSPSTQCSVSPSQTSPWRRKQHSRLSTKDIVLIAAGALVLILLAICCVLLCCLLRKRKMAKENRNRNMAKDNSGKKSSPTSAAEAGGEMGGKLVHFDGPLVFSADDLLCATAEIMGKSSYGTVYKATMEDGIQVAVKRLREKISKGEREFETEVNVLGKIRHPNLLALRAYYLGRKGEKLLVFDYMSNGSLATFLHARPVDMAIDWGTRMKIAKGTTRGLLHLHSNTNIIHGNLTSSNVLLDEHAHPKIADYGLSRLMTTASNANVMATAGALGYRAPELSKLKRATTKTDVYSLGVVLLELLTGKSPGEAVDGVDLPQWVASIVKEEWTNEVFDVELMRDASVIGDQLLNTLKLALHCVDPSPLARPEAHQVLQQLEEIREEEGVAAATTTTGAQGDDCEAVPAATR